MDAHCRVLVHTNLPEVACTPASLHNWSTRCVDAASSADSLQALDANACLELGHALAGMVGDVTCTWAAVPCQYLDLVDKSVAHLFKTPTAAHVSRMASTASAQEEDAHFRQELFQQLHCFWRQAPRLIILRTYVDEMVRR
jgi:hypothetical protein